jgi:hypothetical protein
MSACLLLERECHVAHRSVTKYGLRAATPIENDLDGWKKIDGNPTMKTWIEYTAKDGSSISGWWSATPGTYHATYGALEFVHMIEGRIVITPDGGESVTVMAGDAFTIEKDFVGTWKIEKEVFKYFTINLK